MASLAPPLAVKRMQEMHGWTAEVLAELEHLSIELLKPFEGAPRYFQWVTFRNTDSRRGAEARSGKEDFYRIERKDYKARDLGFFQASRNADEL